jgi:hypothetical protein
LTQQAPHTWARTVLHKHLGAAEHVADILFLEVADLDVDTQAEAIQANMDHALSGMLAGVETCCAQDDILSPETVGRLRELAMEAFSARWTELTSAGPGGTA